MYHEGELLEKEVISSDGSILGVVLEVTIKDDVPHIVVGDSKFLVSKDMLMKGENTIAVPYYEIKALHDKIILSKTLDELSEI